MDRDRFQVEVGEQPLSGDDTAGAAGRNHFRRCDHTRARGGEVKPALLATADGAVFRGRAVGADGVTIGEAVFNTAMTGYQEILTDPSYTGQVVVMTSSHIGNYGVSDDDLQSRTPAVSGFVMRSMARRPSSWRSEGSFAEYLIHHGVVALSDVDTRRLTRHLRDRG